MFNIKIPYNNPRDEKSKIDMTIKTEKMKVEDFIPNELKAKQLENEIESEKWEKDNEENKINEEKNKIFI